MRFQGSVIREQGVTFAIIVVEYCILQNSDKTAAREAIAGGGHVFGDMPIILMAYDSSGIPEYYGRRDIVGFLISVDYTRILWQNYLAE